MKKLSKIKLNQFSKVELDRRKMNVLKGGCECRYSCNDACPSIGFMGVGFDVGTLIGMSDTRSNNYVTRY